MTTTIKRGASKKAMRDALAKMSSAKKKSRGLDAYKYCGIIKLKESPLNIQKGMRGEWR